MIYIWQQLDLSLLVSMDSTHRFCFVLFSWRNVNVSLERVRIRESKEFKTRSSDHIKTQFFIQTSQLSRRFLVDLSCIFHLMIPIVNLHAWLSNMIRDNRGLWFVQTLHLMLSEWWEKLLVVRLTTTWCTWHFEERVQMDQRWTGWEITSVVSWLKFSELLQIFLIDGEESCLRLTGSPTQLDPSSSLARYLMLVFNSFHNSKNQRRTSEESAAWKEVAWITFIPVTQFPSNFKLLLFFHVSINRIIDISSVISKNTSIFMSRRCL